MKYGSGMQTAGTSNGGQHQQQQQYEQGVVIQTTGGVHQQAMFAAMDTCGGQQSSVIKTAPGRANNGQQQQQQQLLLDFSPKQEPIDLAPLTSTHPCLQDLGKMSVGGAQLEHYYSSMNANNQQQQVKAYSSAAGPYYEYLNVGSAAAYHPGQQGPSTTLLQSNNAATTVMGLGAGQQQHQDWPYMAAYGTSHHHSHHQQQQLGGYLGQLDGCVGEIQMGGGGIGQTHQRIYKNGLNGNAMENGGGGGLLSPVDSGIGQELLLEQAKQQLHEFFGPVSLSSAVLLPQTSIQQSSVIQQHHPQQEIDGNQQRQNSRGNNSNNANEQQQQQQCQQRVHEPREQSIPVVIPKLENLLGFQYTLEAPISTSIRKEDDRMTYVNKGQFYTISFDYLPDLRCPLKGLTVRSQVMVVFREDKSYEEELRTWLVWYKRQHSPKQRIIEVDAKNSMGIIGGHFDEIGHNAIQFCWNPAEQPGPKVSIAVQCLSTDFSTQKGVKGLPLHIQVDTYDDQADSKTPFHRGYCQIKVFCDKGAERKLRDEDKRAHRRKNTAAAGSTPSSSSQTPPNGQPSTSSSTTSTNGGGRKKMEGEFHEAAERSHFYHSADLERPAALFVPSDDFFFDTASIGSYDALSELEPQPKRPRPSERIMIYVRKADEDVFTPLHLVPPSLSGLARAISEKYNLDESKIEAFYKQCLKGGVTVKIDDDMLRHYSNQDTFLIELKQSELDRHIFYSITLVELHSSNCIGNGHQSQTPSATSSSSTASEPGPPSGAIGSSHQQQKQQQMNGGNNIW